jgi:hypothetical protein
VSYARRAYRYPLEPLRARRQWERDARRQELARIDARLAQERERLSLAERRFADASQDWHRRVAGAQRLDPGMHQLALDFLADAGASVASQEERVRETLASRHAAAARAMSAQRLLDGIERNRSAAAAAHRRAEQARELGALDAAWIQGAARNRRQP